jgi:hypothetical protein
MELEPHSIFSTASSAAGRTEASSMCTEPSQMPCCQFAMGLPMRRPCCASCTVVILAPKHLRPSATTGTGSSCTGVREEYRTSRAASDWSWRSEGACRTQSNRVPDLVEANFAQTSDWPQQEPRVGSLETPFVPDDGELTKLGSADVYFGTCCS